jgi:hypothetical protein
MDTIQSAAERLGSLIKPQKSGLAKRFASVQTINADGSLKVIPDGSTTPITVGRACNPAVGDRVVILVDKTQWIAVAVVGGEERFSLPLPVSVANGGTGNSAPAANSWIYRSTGNQMLGSVRAGAGLTGWNASGVPTQYAIPLPVASGGTGATTAPAARNNLGIRQGVFNVAIGFGHTAPFERYGNVVMLSSYVYGSPYASVPNHSPLTEILPVGIRPALGDRSIMGFNAGGYTGVVISCRPNGTMEYFTANTTSVSNMHMSCVWLTADTWPA